MKIDKEENLILGCFKSDDLFPTQSRISLHWRFQLLLLIVKLQLAVGASGVIATVVFGLYGNATAAWGMSAKASILITDACLCVNV